MERNKLLSVLSALLLCSAAAVYAQGPNGSAVYYRNANGACGEALKTAMFDIIKSPNVTSYDGLKKAYIKTDTRPDGYLRDWYSSVSSHEPGSNFSAANKEESVGYNREHLFPQSWFNSATPMMSDIVHVVPVDCRLNTIRNDNPLGEVTEKSSSVNTSEGGYSKWGMPKKDLGVPKDVTKVFEPNDEVKGDIARIYFYMATCYQDTILGWTGNNAAMVIGGTTYEPLLPWVMTMMMRWSKLDPVDSMEIARNKAVYEVQKNRNPFVDYPGLEEYVWGSLKEQPFSYNHYVEPDPENPDNPDIPVNPDEPDTPQIELDVAFNNAFFGVEWTGTRPKDGGKTLTGEEGGLSVTYAMGNGQNMYANDTHIRLYQKNTLTLDAAPRYIVNAWFDVLENKSNKEFVASVGTVDGYEWTGHDEVVVFNVSEGTGNVQVAGVTVAIEDEVVGIATIEKRQTDTGIYDLQGRLLHRSMHSGWQDGNSLPPGLKPGIYIRNGRKFVVRR